MVAGARRAAVRRELRTEPAPSARRARRRTRAERGGARAARARRPRRRSGASAPSRPRSAARCRAPRTRKRPTRTRAERPAHGARARHAPAPRLASTAPPRAIAARIVVATALPTCESAGRSATRRSSASRRGRDTAVAAQNDAPRAPRCSRGSSREDAAHARLDDEDRHAIACAARPPIAGARHRCRARAASFCLSSAKAWPNALRADGEDGDDPKTQPERVNAMAARARRPECRGSRAADPHYAVPSAVAPSSRARRRPALEQAVLVLRRRRRRH